MTLNEVSVKQEHFKCLKVNQFTPTRESEDWVDKLLDIFFFFVSNGSCYQEDLPINCRKLFFCIWTYTQRAEIFSVWMFMHMYAHIIVIPDNNNCYFCLVLVCKSPDKDQNRLSDFKAEGIFIYWLYFNKEKKRPKKTRKCLRVLLK